MKKLVGVMALMLAFLAAGAAPVPPAQSKPAGPNYADPTYHFGMATPVFVPAKDERAVIATFQSAPADGFSPNVTVIVDPVKTTRKEYVDASMTLMEQTNPRANKRPGMELQVSGMDAEILDYDLNLGGRRVRILQLLVIAPTKVFIVTCTAPVETYAKWEPEFKKVVDSFHLES
ncbi:MAG TPA: hypothetical protein VGN88_12885 [Phycisphaerae bacterium]